MRFLTPDEWQTWCRERQVPLREIGHIRPDIRANQYHVTKLPYPSDSGMRVSFARRLFSLVSSDAETLILLDEWSVWPSSQHMPLFTRFREALGEHRPLHETPGHGVALTDADDGISIIATALLFIWDCYGISSTGSDAFHFSRDEFCYFASRDADVAERVAAKFAKQ